MGVLMEESKQESIDQDELDELFGEGAEAVETSKEEPKAEEAKPETEEAKEARERDEKGRFKAKEETPEAEEEVKAETEEEQVVEEKPEEEKQDHRVPLMELLNEREKRQEEQRQREALQNQLWQLQQQLESKQQPEPEPIDPFQDPEGWQRAQTQTVEDRMRAMEGNFSLRLAKAVHKETFDEAWSEMMRQAQSGNHSMRQQVLNSSDPGETLVSLYKQHKTFTEVNGDPNAWLESKKQEWLKDPEVQAAILAQAKQTAVSTQPQKPNVKLPPSMNKAGGSGAERGHGDLSDGALWEETL
jgi:hypothetical protein